MSNRPSNPADSSHGQPAHLPLDDRSHETRRIESEVTEIAEDVARLEATDVAEDVAKVTVRRQLRPLETLLLVMLTVSLLIHALTIARLFQVRDTLREEIGRLADNVQAAKNTPVRYTLPIDQQIPINMDVPINRSLQIPINTEVRIKQDIVIPVDTGFGQLEIPVPVDANVPISTTVPIEFNQTVNISTTVPLRLEVPIQIDLGSEELSGYLDRLHNALLDLRGKL